MYSESTSTIPDEKSDSHKNDMTGIQNRDMESEKMKAMTSLVNGVAHAMNTPLGVGITAISFLITQIDDLEELIHSEVSGYETIKTKLTAISDSSQMVQKNLITASSLVSEFKLLSDYHDESRPCDFNLASLIADIVGYIKIKYDFKTPDFKINLNMPECSSIMNYPSAFIKILSNLFENSILHGFRDRDGGSVTISIELEGEYLYLNYGDNGRGPINDQLHRLFEPFYTTRMGIKSRGLGLSIVYNLVVNIMNGEIELYINQNGGLEIVMRFLRFPKTMNQS